MIIGPRRLVLIGAIAAIALTIIFYPLLVATPFDPEDVRIILSSVTLPETGVADQELNLRVVLNLTNTSDFTLTTSKIEYELFADGESLGTDTISYEDIPVNGRPALFSNAPPITISDTFNFRYTDQDAFLFDKVRNGSGDISWRITGSASIESGTSFQEKPFSDEV